MSSDPQDYFKQLMEMIYQTVTTQKAFKYGSASIFHYFFCCNGDGSQRREEMLFNKGMKKLQTDIDIINLIKVVRGYRNLRRMFLSKEQNIMLGQQRRDIIQDHGSSGSSSYSDHSDCIASFSKAPNIK